jgi:hypothetical protein
VRLPFASPSITARRSELDHAQAALEEALREKRATAERLAAARAARERLADDPDRYAENEAEIRRLEAERSRLELVVRRREEQRSRAARRLAEAELAALADKVRKAYQERAKASQAVADLLGDLNRAVARLERARRKAEDAEAELEARERETGLDADWPRGDEPDWPDVAETLEVVTRGPRQPARRTEEALAELERRRREALEARARKAAAEAVYWGSLRDVEALDDEGRALALRAAEEMAQAEIEKRREALSDPETFQLAAAGERAKRVITVVEDRLKRVRSLAQPAGETEEPPAEVEEEATAEAEAEREAEPAAA